MLKNKKQALKQTINSARLICHMVQNAQAKQAQKIATLILQLNRQNKIETAPDKNPKRNISAFKNLIQNRNIKHSRNSAKFTHATPKTKLTVKSTEISPVFF